MATDFVPVLLMLGFGVAIAGFILLITHFVGPKRPGPEKLTAYESGKPTIGDARLRFPIRFYIIAMLFIIFDIEVVFLYPWAVVYRRFLSQGWFIFVEMLVFVGILLVGYIYAWKRGALEWE